MSISNKEHTTSEFPMYLKFEDNAQIKDYNEIHKHKAAEIIYITKGSARIFIDYKYFSVSEGDVFFINADVAHSIIIKEPNQIEFFYFEYLPELVHTYGENQFNAIYFLWLELNFPFFHTTADNKLSSILKNAYQIFTNKKYGYEFALLASLLDLNMWLFKKWDNETDISLPEISLPETQYLKNIFEAIASSYNSITIADLANSISMAPSIFSKWFKNLTNIPIAEYIENYKISQAKFLLISTSQSITDIALNMGFSTQTYFSRLFKLHTGVSPTNFRKQHSVKNFLINHETKLLKNEAPIKSTNKNLYYKSIFLSIYTDCETPRKRNTRNDFVEIIFVDSGELIIDYENKFYLMKAGDITIIAPNQSHIHYSITDQANTFLLQFYPEILKFGGKKNHLEDALIEITENKFIPITKNEEGYQDILKEFVTLYSDQYRLDRHNELRTRMRILKILSWILERKKETVLHTESDETENKSTLIIKEILEYIDNNFTQNLSLKELAKKYSVNYSYLSRKFKEITHTTFNKYINAKRIYRSTILLATTNDSIAKIASDVGFCSQSRFSEIFIIRHLIPPKEYRKRFKNKIALRESFKNTYKDTYLVNHDTYEDK